MKNQHQDDCEIEEVYQMTGDEYFGIDLALALAESGDTVYRKNGTALTYEDVTAEDWQLAKGE